MRLIFLLFLFSSCGTQFDFGQYSKLTDLRVLSIVANPPESSPGASVTLAPYVSDIHGGGRTLRYSVEGCIDPGLALGAEPSCEGRADRTVLVENAALTGLSSPNYTGAAPAVTVTIPSNIFDGRNAMDQYNGVAYLVFYRILSAEGMELFSAVKRIWSSSRATKNSNPDLSELLVNGASAGTLPTTKADLSAKFGGTSAETYTQLDNLGQSVTKQESLYTSWFVSDGSLGNGTTILDAKTAWAPPETAPSGRNVIVIGVTRDGRGGEAVKLITF